MHLVTEMKNFGYAFARIIQPFRSFIIYFLQYFNVPNRFVGDIPQGLTLGQGPFREVRLLVDGQVAGVAFPYATIFTGGFTPPCWR
jgi:hypothetical protein